VPRRTVLRRSVPALSTGTPPEGAPIPSWLSPLLGNVERTAIRRMRQDSEAQRFLVKYLGILSHLLTKPELRYVVVTHINDLIALSLDDDHAAKANRLDVPEARLKAIKSDILENLSSPELTETAVALRQRLTSRYIRKLFQAKDTTFSKFVLSHRLMRAHRLLSDPLFADMRIIDIALAVGFSDFSYFDRTFRRQFHAAPSEVRAIARLNRVVSGERAAN
jgi:transcriptional regulator GlxA family with amidase domain